ncbi:hypothetical protein [Litoreibacter arenae]|nr:hypothetical protein [Litoreibacter arenae]
MDANALFYFASQRPVSEILKFVEDNGLIPNTNLYEFPWMGEVERSFSGLNELVKFLETQFGQEYPIYFKDSQGEHYFVGITADGRIIFGLPYSGRAPESLAAKARTYGGFYGYIGAGMPEIGSIEKFKLDPEYHLPKLLDDGHIAITATPMILND